MGFSSLPLWFTMRKVIWSGENADSVQLKYFIDLKNYFGFMSDVIVGVMAIGFKWNIWRR